MDAEAAEEEREEDADDLIFAGAPVFGVEPGALLVVHAGGVDGVDGICMLGPLESLRGDIRERRSVMVPVAGHRPDLSTCSESYDSLVAIYKGFLPG